MTKPQRSQSAQRRYFAFQTSLGLSAPCGCRTDMELELAHLTLEHEAKS